MNWQFNNEKPIYIQLVEQIQQAVITGEYEPGAKLPGVRDLASEAGVNPNTMQRALAELESGGLLYTQRTSGRFVTSDTSKIARLRSEAALVTAKEFVAKMQALKCSTEEISAFIKQAEEEF